MSKQHCSLSYHKALLDELDVFAVGVRDGIYNNATTFTSPPLTQTAFQALIDNYINTRALYVQGGLAQKGPFRAAKTALINGLDTTADYVDGIANGDANIITLADFVPTKAGDSEGHVPAQTAAPKLERGAAGELLAEVPAVTGAEYYGCILIAGQQLPPFITLNALGQLIAVAENDNNPNPTPDPEPRPLPGSVIVAIDFTKSRKKKFTGLQYHMVYYAYYFAGNATGVSPLSPVSSLEVL